MVGRAFPMVGGASSVVGGASSMDSGDRPADACAGRSERPSAPVHKAEAYASSSAVPRVPTSRRCQSRNEVEAWLKRRPGPDLHPPAPSSCRTLGIAQGRPLRDVDTRKGSAGTYP